MSFNWEEYLMLSECLLDDDIKNAVNIYSSTYGKTISEEAMLRASISRAYYSAFKYAKKQSALTGTPAISNIPNASHLSVISAYKNSTDNIHVKVGTNLGKMKQNRIKADYKDTILDPTDRAVNNIEWAKKIFELI